MAKTISKPMRRRVTEALCKAGLDGNGRFPSLSRALAAAFNALALHGIEAADVVSGDMLLGDRGSRQVGLAFSNEANSFSPRPIESSVLAFTWAKLDSSYEVVAYIS